MSILFQNLGESEMQKAFEAFWNNCESQRVQQAQKLWYWYIRDKEQVTADIKAALKKFFTKEKTIKKMNIRAFLIVDRILDRISKTYKTPATRTLDGGIQITLDEQKIEKTLQSKSDEIYQEMIEDSTLTKQLREFEQQVNYFNICFMQPVWREFDDKSIAPYMDFMIHNPAWTIIQWDNKDFRYPAAFYYPIWTTLDGKIEQKLVYWSKDEHFYIDRLGNRKQVPGMSNMLNPYKTLPLAFARIKESTDGYGEGMWELVEGNEEVCVQATNLYYTALFQAHGQPVSINMGLNGEVEIGPDKPIQVEDSGKNLQENPPQFFFANANPHIKEVQDLINWTIGMLQNVKGMTGQSLSLDPVIQSGISKIQDSAEVQENREDKKKIFEEFEHELFRITRAVWNYHNPNKKIDENAKFAVRFSETKVIKSTDEKVKEREAALKQGTASRIDFIMEDHPEMNREEAEKKLEQNLSENRRFEDQFASLFENNNQPAEGVPAKV